MPSAPEMNKGGDLLAMLSPAAAIAQSMKAGKPVGLANLSPMAHLMGRKGGSGAAASPEEAQAMPASGMSAMERPQLPTRGMKKGRMVRGDGCCMRGKTKGTMR